MPDRVPPIEVDAASPPKDPKNGAAIIFIHGLGDDGKSWEPVAHQFQAAKKLPHMTWILPNAPEHRDAMTTAWYTPSGLSPFPPQRPELADDEDEDGLLASRAYIDELIDDLGTRKGIPPERIVVAGFSQGCAMCLLTGLTSPKYAGKIAGIAGLCGYMPLEHKMEELRKDSGLPEKEVGGLKVFLARGKADQLVPGRYFAQAKRRLEEMGMDMDGFEGHEVERMGHQASGALLRDMCTWLEGVVPEKE